MAARRGGAPNELPAGGIDSPGPNSEVHRGPLLAGGWALGPDGPPEEALIVIDGSRAVAATVGESRPDIGAAHPGVRRAELAGWSVELDMRQVSGSSATLTLIARLGDGEWRELAVTRVNLEAPGALRDRAVFTIVQNEATFLPIWLRYYSRHFDSEDIYVLDHDSTDGSTAGLEGKCNVISVHRDRKFDHMWLKGVVEDFQAFLLRSYGTVLFAEADEFVVADPGRYEGLAQYVAQLDGPAATCTGYNVIQQPGEPPLRFGEPLLAQRSQWNHSPQYSKRLLSRVPLRWNAGFHIEYNAPAVAADPELLLIHLHRVDYEYCLARHRAALEMRWAEEDRKWNLGWHQRVVEPEEFDEWFRAGADLEGSTREPIPERLRGVL